MIILNYGIEQSLTYLLKCSILTSEANVKISERLVIMLGLVGILKPCCLLLWAASFLGTSSAILGTASTWVVSMMPYEKYFIIFAFIWIGVGQYEIWTALYRRMKSPLKTPWKNWLVKFTAIQVSTVVTLYLFFAPGLMPWNMNH